MRQREDGEPIGNEKSSGRRHERLKVPVGVTGRAGWIARLLHGSPPYYPGGKHTTIAVAQFQLV